MSRKFDNPTGSRKFKFSKSTLSVQAYLGAFRRGNPKDKADFYHSLGGDLTIYLDLRDEIRVSTGGSHRKKAWGREMSTMWSQFANLGPKYMDTLKSSFPRSRVPSKDYCLDMMVIADPILELESGAQGASSLCYKILSRQISNPVAD